MEENLDNNEETKPYDDRDSLINHMKKELSVGKEILIGRPFGTDSFLRKMSGDSPDSIRLNMVKRVIEIHLSKIDRTDTNVELGEIKDGEISIELAQQILEEIADRTLGETPVDEWLNS